MIVGPTFLVPRVPAIIGAPDSATTSSQSTFCAGGEATTAVLDGPRRCHPATFAQDPLPGELGLEAPVASPLLLEAGQRRVEEPAELLRRGAELGRQLFDGTHLSHLSLPLHSANWRASTYSDSLTC